MSKYSKQNILYSPLYLLFHGIALMPFCVLYRISDFLYLVLYYIVGYRVDIVKKNIANAFPDKSEKEREKIISEFYSHLADYFVETIKMLRISDKEMKRRMVFENISVIEECFSKGRSIICFTGHYANWEYIAPISLWITFDKSKSTIGHIYRPLRNQWFDSLFYNIRGRYSENYKMKSVFRDIIRQKQSGKVSLIGSISDQHPSTKDSDHVIRFLNHDTAFITGTEVIARKLDLDVLYYDVERVKRGYYKTTIRTIQLNPNEAEEFVITDRYAAMLEKSIHRNPSLWLWTHNRWKHKVGAPQPSKA